MTDIHGINISGANDGNLYYIKRDDQFGGSFGGNKVRKAQYFFEEILDGEYDCVVTYGSINSNHCRAVAEMCVANKLKCTLVVENSCKKTVNFNYEILNLLNVDIVEVENENDNVKNCIADTMKNLRENGYNPYFIPGGGHAPKGTAAYVEAYNEIVKHEKENNIEFDYIFCCCGTGTTYAGLVAGKILNGHDKTIIGISNARSEERCREEVANSLKDYFEAVGENIDDSQINCCINVTDKYVGKGYGELLDGMTASNCEFYKDNGILFDEVYMGKVLYGMKDYIKENGIEKSKILLVHTGGLPLAFNSLREKI